ncbi:MAG TPA: hypothetical protein VFY75_10610 [Solirubrobacterales bacterium]|nr:hypothetical protein [Solirubrobacterales bacterium]
MKARGGLAILACMAAVLSLPASGLAKPGYYVQKPVRLAYLHLQASNGYRAYVFGYNRHQVNISVSSNSGAVSYSVRGRVTDDEIEARFGSRGRIAMRFEPQGRPEIDAVPPNCKGKPSVDLEGRFVGRIRFEGEDGFTRIRSRVARGSVLIGHRMTCKRAHRKKRKSRGARPAVITLTASTGDRESPSYAVYKEDSDEAIHIASVLERRQGMTIVRSASEIAEPETFTVSPLGSSPLRATVSPPAPFSGSAAFEKTPDGPTVWSGDLSAELPGLGTVPLTGPDYRAQMCRSFACLCPGETCGVIVVVSGRPKPAYLRRLVARIKR